MVTFNKDQKNYGLPWDIGDVIGCCLDLDNKIAEYYINGKSLGIAFSDIPTGENIAYFPGISFSQSEICIFNFGNSPFMFNELYVNSVDGKR